MAIRYIPFYPEPIEGQAVLNNFKRTLRYHGTDKLQDDLRRGMPLYELEKKEEVDSALSGLLRETVQAMLENELAGCSNRAALTAFTGTYSIEITGIEQAYIERTGMGFFDDNNAFRISFDLDTNSEFMLNDYGRFRASYTGQIYRMADGSLRFLTNTVHACQFTGMFGNYSLSETSE